MCRIKRKNQNDQSNQKSCRRDDKSDEFFSLEILLMIKRLIDEPSELTVNSVNSHIIKKILNSDGINHIFCNRLSFIT
jgi:hypothetical protein